jgi:hypothetical protein
VKTFALLALLVISAAARADDSKPWAKGVPDDVQASAQKLFEDGNGVFAEQKYAAAIEKYRAALELWDHPLIRFNLAAALIGADRFVEAADALERSLRFGAAPFPPDKYQQALEYQHLLARSVGTIEASCDQPGVRVSLDGKPWLDCPGKRSERVLAGAHGVVGERAGFVTSAQRVFVTGGATAEAPVRLVTLESTVTLKYRYARWLPWTIAGGGAGVALVGLGVWLAGRSGMDAFRSQLGMTCPSGCNLATQPALTSERDHAEHEGDAGLAMEAVGGAAAIVGVVLAISNHAERIVPKVLVEPMAGGMSARVGWRF